MDFANHTHVTGIILNLNNLGDFVKTKRNQSSLLVFRGSYAAPNLLYFNCCHCQFPLTVKHLLHVNATLTCNLVCVTHLRQSENCGFHQIVGVG